MNHTERFTTQWAVLLVAYLLMFVTVIACTPGQSGLVKPQTAEDKIMTAYSSVGAAYQTIADLARRGAITREQGLRLIGHADDAKKLIDNADALRGSGKPESAAQSLEFAITILSALEKETKDAKDKGGT